MNARDVWILYRRELRSALRERTIVVNSILMPLFLYPILLWLMFTGMTFVAGLAERAESRVVVFDVPPAHGELLDSLRRAERVVLLEDLPGPDSARALLLAREVDAVAVFRPATGSGSAAAGNFRVEVSFDGAIERSRRARDRVEEIVSVYRDTWVERQAEALGIAKTQMRQFLVVRENVSSEREMGALILGALVPLLMVIMVALGCFVPSVDTTAGERERSTWETLMTVSASRLSIVTAKYLYVATLGITAGFLNVIAMLVSLGAIIAPLMAQAGDAGDAFRFSLSWTAVPVMLAAAVVLALFFAAAMMILAAFARTFKDGQAMVTPVYWLALAPILIGQQTDRTLDATLAAVPVANTAMMIRDAIHGVFLWPYIAETLAVMLALVGVCLLAARAVLGFEDFLLGSFDGSFWRFARERLFKRSGVRRGAPAAPSVTEEP